MTAFATYNDVAARWRPLSAAEQETAETLLTDVSGLIRSQVPTIDARLDAGTLDAGIVRMVAARSVIRSMQNPEGYRTESDGDYSYTRDESRTSGELYVSAADLALLRGGSASRVGTIHVREPQWLREAEHAERRRRR